MTDFDEEFKAINDDVDLNELHDAIIDENRLVIAVFILIVIFGVFLFISSGIIHILF
jgi:hypothetical protein